MHLGPAPEIVQCVDVWIDGLAESGQRLLQHDNRFKGINGFCLLLFGQLLSMLIHHQRQMQVVWRRITKQGLQILLAKGGIQQICAANDFGYSAGSIVYHHGQLIGKIAIRATNDKITPMFCQVQALSAKPPVSKADFLISYFEPQAISAFRLE